MGADGVEADEIDFDPGGLGCGTEGSEAVAGDAVGADDALVFGFGEVVHDAAIAGGPVGLGDAVDEDYVDVVDTQFAAEAIEIAPDAGWVAVVGLGHDDDFIAGELFDRGGYVGMAAVGVGGVEEAEAVLVEAVDEEAREGAHTETGLIGGSAEAYGAGAHGETAGADAGLAEDDLVVGVEFTGGGVEGEDGGKGGRRG